MKTIVRASVFGFTLAISLGTVACWPVAPAGGDALDAAAPPIPGSDASFTGADADATTDAPVTDSAQPDQDGASDAGNDADAADGTAPAPPYPSATLATGVAFGCHIMSNLAVWCWGANPFGQIGPVDDGGPQRVVLPGDAGPLYATAVALGDDYACAIAADAGGAVYCWGRNDKNQLGHSGSDVSCNVQGQGTVECNPTPTVATGVSGASLLAAAGAETCAATSSGTVQCWGSPPTGAGADASTSLSASSILQLSIASDHSCALSDAGVAGNVMACWGDNVESQSSPVQYCASQFCATPITVPGIASPAAVAVGLGFSCAVPLDGGVLCFGGNTSGELGHPPNAPDAGDYNFDDGGVVYNPTPESVAGLTGTVAALIATGTNQAACALLTGGTVQCWGNVGAGAWGPDGGLPPLSALGTPDALYVCGESTDGGVWCWSLDGGAPTQVQ